MMWNPRVQTTASPEKMKNDFVGRSKCRRIEEADISSALAVDQRAVDEAVRSFTADVDRHLPSSTSSFSSCSVLVGPLLSNAHHCGTVPLHTSSYCAIGKFFFSKANNPPPFKLHKLLKFLLISSWMHTH
ncbi:hypothetical protein TNCV_5085131 [Trichonephila clavipes]|uniref:Uncharacterized protein n=1 Tax=Trichonephila clavipes TaxID=2585209 RepID=A0A8X6SF64_TRICX|nr:hypothetical protein TNCV_5085131 [Trichonephila clavipes]